MPIYEKAEPITMRCLRELQVPPGTHMIDQPGQLIEEARNGLTAEVLTTNCTHLLWIDDDMTFKPDSLMRLLAHAKPIVGGLCFSRHFPYHPVLGRRLPEWCAREIPYGFVYQYPPDALLEVDVTGAAFLLVERQVLDRMFEKCGRNWFTKRKFSEDWSFCERAKELGFPIYVDTGTKLGHIGKFLFDEESVKKVRPFEWESWIPDMTEDNYVDGKPMASIVIPTFNQVPKYLKAAILSAAKQTLPVEVIVVDDGSDPPVPLTGWPANVRVLRQGNAGISRALNAGIATMTTDWFCWLSSDDMFATNKVERQLAALSQARLKAGFHRYQSVIDGDDGWSTFSVLPVWRTILEQQSMLAQSCMINGSTVMLHRSIFDEVGLFDPSYRYSQDWEMWCRVAQKHFWFGLGDNLGTRREGANLTAAIEKDTELTRVRDAENEAIQAKYTPAR
jgi:GT2 family glycosyltransferase